jgi:hypothetical protein
MDIIRLRILTEKSTLSFGQYADMSVGNLLALQKSTYLRWVYYNCSTISFTPDVLNQIFIYPDERIEKPGKDELKGIEVDKRCKAHLDFRASEHMMKKIKYHQKTRRILIRRTHELKYSELTALNRGHKIKKRSI